MTLAQKVLIGGLTLAQLLLNGCASSGDQAEGISSGTSPVEEKIMRLAELAVEHAQEVADLNRSRYMEIHGDGPRPDDLHSLPHLTKVVNLGASYSGPLEGFIKALSVRSGMNTPRFLNVQPSNPVIIEVHTDYRPVWLMLREAGVQSGTRAVIAYKVAENLIEVSYATY